MNAMLSSASANGGNSAQLMVGNSMWLFNLFNKLLWIKI